MKLLLLLVIIGVTAAIPTTLSKPSQTLGAEVAEHEHQEKAAVIEAETDVARAIDVEEDNDDDDDEEDNNDDDDDGDDDDGDDDDGDDDGDGDDGDDNEDDDDDEEVDDVDDEEEKEEEDTDLARAIKIEEEYENRSDEEEAYLTYLENQKRLALKFGANFGSLGGFNLGGGLGPGQTGLGAGAQLGPLGFKLGGGLGLQQTGLGGGVQLGPLGFGASTGYKNYGLGLNANAGLGNNYLGYGNHYTQHAARHIGGGLGVKLGGLGAGVSAGLGNGGVGFNANAGLGNFLHYGTPVHYSQYYSKPKYPQYGPWVPVQSRKLGFGLGANLGPTGAGASAGIGHGQVGFSGGFGFGGNYANYGQKPHYQQYYAIPNRGPWFGPNNVL